MTRGEPGIVERLLPCPFCGSAAEIVELHNGRAWGLCDNRACFTQGPIRPRRQLAISAWNNRHEAKARGGAE